MHIEKPLSEIGLLRSFYQAIRDAQFPTFYAQNRGLFHQKIFQIFLQTPLTSAI